MKPSGPVSLPEGFTLWCRTGDPPSATLYSTAMTYPIEPGSELDKAIDEMVERALNRESRPSFERFHLIDPANTSHMTAAGLRAQLRSQGGATSAEDLPEELRAKWFGAV